MTLQTTLQTHPPSSVFPRAGLPVPAPVTVTPSGTPAAPSSSLPDLPSPLPPNTGSCPQAPWTPRCGAAARGSRPPPLSDQPHGLPGAPSAASHWADPCHLPKCCLYTQTPQGRSWRNIQRLPFTWRRLCRLSASPSPSGRVTNSSGSCIRHSSALGPSARSRGDLASTDLPDSWRSSDTTSAVS